MYTGCYETNFQSFLWHVKHAWITKGINGYGRAIKRLVWNLTLWRKSNNYDRVLSSNGEDFAFFSKDIWEYDLQPIIGGDGILSCCVWGGVWLLVNCVSSFLDLPGENDEKCIMYMHVPPWYMQVYIYVCTRRLWRKNKQKRVLVQNKCMPVHLSFNVSSTPGSFIYASLLSFQIVYMLLNCCQKSIRFLVIGRLQNWCSVPVKYVKHVHAVIDEFQINKINVYLRTSGFDNEVLSVDACAVWWERESFYCLPRISVVTWHREPRFQCGSARTWSIWNSSIGTRPNFPYTKHKVPYGGEERPNKSGKRSCPCVKRSFKTQQFRLQLDIVS